MEVDTLTREMNMLSLECSSQSASDYTEEYMMDLERFYNTVCRKHTNKTHRYTVEGLNNIRFNELEVLYSIYKARYSDMAIEEFKSRLSFTQGYNWIDGKQQYYWYISLVNMSYVASYIPDSIDILSRLCTLKYSWNELVSIPSTVWQLFELQSLDLSHNCIESIPEAIGNLTNLRDLYLDHNNIKTVPSTLYNLTLLRYADLSYNPIKSMPPGIEKMKSLVTLRLHHTYMRQYPRGAERKVNLVMEDLRGDYNTTCISWSS